MGAAVQSVVCVVLGCKEWRIRIVMREAIVPFSPKTGIKVDLLLSRSPLELEDHWAK